MKPWLGELQASAPTDFKAKRGHSRAPEGNLVLSRVHGYRTFDSRNNLRFSSNKEVVYPAAGLGVVLDPRTNNQRFFAMHDDDVVCLSVSPDRKLAVTGQMARVGKSRALELHIWSIKTLESLSCLKGFHRRAIRHVAFSPGGSRILSVGEDDDHSLAVYN